MEACHFYLSFVSICWCARLALTILFSVMFKVVNETPQTCTIVWGKKAQPKTILTFVKKNENEHVKQQKKCQIRATNLSSFWLNAGYGTSYFSEGVCFIWLKKNKIETYFFLLIRLFLNSLIFWGPDGKLWRGGCGPWTANWCSLAYAHAKLLLELWFCIYGVPKGLHSD